jgi:hypothetical protein
MIQYSIQHWSLFNILSFFITKNKKSTLVNAFQILNNFLWIMDLGEQIVLIFFFKVLLIDFFNYKKSDFASM